MQSRIRTVGAWMGRRAGAAARRLIQLGAIVAMLLPLAAEAATAPTRPLEVTLGRSVAPLNGPWRFHLGDDPRWADPGFDDSGWESVDLTPEPGANDGDVGYPGYVAGWNARGHRGYSGYAWYRMRVAVAAPPDFRLAMTGPPIVDSAYQAFFNGRLLGGSGTFRGRTPTVYAPQPRRFALPATGGGVIAIRVWAGPGRVSGAPDAGGIRIAPAIGEAGAIGERYLIQWRQTLLGYVVDIIPGLLLLGLAVMAASLSPFAPKDRAYLWMAAGLLLLAAFRFNQAVVSWWQIESLPVYAWLTRVLATPLTLGAWTMAWLAWFRIERPRRIWQATAALTAIYLLSLVVGGTWSPAFHPTGFSAAMGALGADLRLGFLALQLLIAGLAAIRLRVKALPGLLAMATVGVGLFAAELSAVHIKGIWFPYGVGLSRSEIAYLALAPLMFALLLGRLLDFARALREHGQAPEPQQAG